MAHLSTRFSTRLVSYALVGAILGAFTACMADVDEESEWVDSASDAVSVSTASSSSSSSSCPAPSAAPSSTSTGTSTGSCSCPLEHPACNDCGNAASQSECESTTCDDDDDSTNGETSCVWN